jgi:hypothetical protein
MKDLLEELAENGNPHGSTPPYLTSDVRYD